MIKNDNIEDYIEDVIDILNMELYNVPFEPIIDKKTTTIVSEKNKEEKKYPSKLLIIDRTSNKFSKYKSRRTMVPWWEQYD